MQSSDAGLPVYHSVELFGRSVNCNGENYILLWEWEAQISTLMNRFFVLCLLMSVQVSN